MTCPNCGAKMKEGTLYCEKCGEDIHIVPDFEPELEHSIAEGLENAFQEAVVEQEEKLPDRNTSHGEKAVEKKSVRTGLSIPLLIGWTCIVLLGIALFGAGIHIYHRYSLDYQVKRAVKSVERLRYESAVEHYNRALQLNSTDVSLKFSLAEVYFLMNEKEEYEKLLMEIVHDPNTDSEQLESAYGKLIAIYKAKDDYQSINDMLLECGSDSIRTLYQKYISEEPRFSVSSGSYTGVTPIKLTVTGKGRIYYTLDGSEPDETSILYTTPILLEEGNYTVKALYINENGVASKMVEESYRIRADELEIPEINPESGDYNVPVMITVMNGSENVYYTTDGSIPTMDSNLYTGPVPMALGTNIMRFARLEAGRSSQVTERVYTLNLLTEFTPEQAVLRIQDYLLKTNKIYDRAGHFNDTSAFYEYLYQYVVNIDEIDDFYVVAEVLVDTQGVRTKTGNFYAVNAYSGYLYKLQMEHGIYSLTDLPNQSEIINN